MKRKPGRNSARRQLVPAKPARPTTPAKLLLADVRDLILAARQTVARGVNAALVALYWKVGERIHKEVLKEKRAEYGGEILSALSKELCAEFGNGFSVPNLSRMMRFAEVFPDERIISTLSQELGWSHFVEILPLKQPLQRDFYAEMCRIERWSVRAQRQKIDGMLFERTALSKKPEKLATMELRALRDEDKLTPDLVFRDPYLLNFLGLKDTYAEKDLEAAILREIETFILELGRGFAFVERQKRITVDGDDYYLDLLFYHRHLRRLVAIDLKIGEFRPADSGQMELYLRWLDKYERSDGEETPIGLILCAGKKEETIRLLDLGERGIQVSSYWTEVLPKEKLQRKLHDAMRLARARLEARKD